MIVPGSAVVVSFVDFLISFGILVVMMVIFGFAPTWKMLTIAGLRSAGFCAGDRPGVVNHRAQCALPRFSIRSSLRRAVRVCIVSPVGFSSDIVREKFGDSHFSDLYSLNPMVGVIDGFRWAILGNAEIYWPGFCLSIGIGSRGTVDRRALFPQDRAYFCGRDLRSADASEPNHDH